MRDKTFDSDTGVFEDEDISALLQTEPTREPWAAHHDSWNLMDQSNQEFLAPKNWSPLNRPFTCSVVKSHLVMKPAKCVAIMGSATPTRYEAPLNDPKWEIWTLNNLAPRDADGRIRADRWFEIHEPRVRTSERWDRIARIPRPVYCRNPSEFAHGVAFPFGELRAVKDYFADSFAYMLALAYVLGYKTVGLYGAHLLTGSPRERTVEAACVSWWLGFLEGKGVKVIVPQTAWGLAQHPALYGDENERLLVGCLTAALELADKQATSHPVAFGAKLPDIMGW